jgi:hypothetical protein
MPAESEWHAYFLLDQLPLDASNHTRKIVSRSFPARACPLLAWICWQQEGMAQKLPVEQ